MIISHKYKYLFIELQHTASTAISKELGENYDGVPILHRHGYYHEFLKVANDKEKEYFVFSCLRNPLDVAVTIYFKFKTNHKGVFTDPKNWKKNGGHLGSLALKRFNFVRNSNVDFPTFFRKFYRLPYDNWSSLAHHRFDFIIRFENLQTDFAKALELIGIEPKGPLPAVNPTGEKRSDFLSYYTPEIHSQARWVFGPFMQKWGYDFPAEWGDPSVPRSSQMLFDVLSSFRRHLEWRSSNDFGTINSEQASAYGDRSG